jgi:hypothetical protein
VKKGESLQRLVHAIETATSNSTNVKVESPKFMPDKDTGRSREHDVVLTFTDGHHELLVALECRDRSRAVGVPDVEQFHTKCLRTGIDHGIIVSGKGFTKTAVTKAESFNIGCLTVDQVAQFNWCQTPGVTVLNHDLRGAHLHAETDQPLPEGSTVVYTDGRPFLKEAIGQMALNCFNNYVDKSIPDGEHEFSFVQANPPLLFTYANGIQLPVKMAKLTAKYAIERVFVPFEIRRYFDMAKNKGITEAAIASIQLGNQPTSVVMATQADGSSKVSLVPTPPAKTSKD